MRCDVNLVGQMSETKFSKWTIETENYFFRKIVCLKSDSHLPQKFVLFACLLKMMKNAFYFILKALFVLKIFKLLSRLSDNAGKTA